MNSPIIINRRSRLDRRLFNYQPGGERRYVFDRRAPGTDAYVLMLGDVGVDLFTMTLSLPVTTLVLVGIAVGAIL